ncbi:hypothetical protein [Lewinella sp. W8]|uniref:hypothetical protein n=1 Tax=Lewinella sp. W8 TaxID=2528208 RepID=UPI001067E6BB|nr:hypothetical protein [Lewinella sp. W8]MTB52505.1 hypothetical protein [Lewinella sp. W8]
MMRLTLILLLLLPLGLRAQSSLLDRVSRDICACMQGVRSAEAVEKAESCLESSTEDLLPEILAKYDLNVSVPSDRRRFGNLLVDRLAEDCPILLTLELPSDEKQRWSDGKSEDHPPTFRSKKAPPPPPMEATTGEVPTRWKFSGTISVRPVGGVLRLKDESGEEVTFEVPRGLLKPYRLHVGDRVDVEYRREWRKGPRKIVLVVTEISGVGGD